jgi:hypothetical protein
MPAKGRVSIGWQIVFIFISPLNIWAFYRIKRLTKAALYIFAPSMAIQIPIMLETMKMAFNPTLLPEPDEYGNISLMDPVLYVISFVASIGFTALAIYLVIKWSEEWNKQFSA